MRIFSLWLLFLFSGPLWAGLHFEPYAGYGALWANDRLLNVRTETLSSSYEYIQEGRFYHGASGGARVGYSRLGLAVGLDFTLGRMWGVSEDLAPVIFGVFASYKFPALFRIYGVLIPGRLGSYPLSRWHIIPKRQTEDPAPFCNAWGGKAGVSYLSLPFFSVNLEYQPLQVSGSGACKSVWSHSVTAFINFIL